MEGTLVFIDEGFLDKLTKLFGKGKRIKFDKFEFAKRIAKKQNLLCKHLYYFCPAIKDIKDRDKIEVILYTYFDRKRKSKFSLSNELITCCSSYFKLTKEDFTSCPLKGLKEPN